MTTAALVLWTCWIAFVSILAGFMGLNSIKTGEPLKTIFFIITVINGVAHTIAAIALASG